MPLIPSSPIRSPSHKASGLRPDAVRCLRLRSVAFFSFVSLAKQSCRFACGAIEQITLNGAGLAGRALAHTRTIVGLAGPKPSAFLPQRVDVAIPRRRTAILCSPAYPLHLRLLGQPPVTITRSHSGVPRCGSNLPSIRKNVPRV